MNTVARTHKTYSTPEAELTLTRSQLQAVMDAIDAVILVVDKDLVVRFANKNLGEVWGLDPTSLIGRKKPEAITNKIKYLFENPDGFESRLFWLYDHPHEIAYDEVVMIHPKRRLFGRFSAPVLDDGSNILGRVEVYTDISKERAMEEELQRRNEELLAFREIAVVVGHSLDLQTILEAALRKLLEVMKVESGCICLERMSHEAHKTSIFLGMSPAMRDQICLHCRDTILGLSDREREHPLVLMSDLASHPEVSNFPDLQKCETLAVAPLTAKGRSLGWVCLASTAVNPMLQERRAILALIACQIGAAVENANLYAETRRRQRMERALDKVGLQILASLDLERILKTVVQEAKELFQCDCSGIALFDDEHGELRWRFAAGHCPVKTVSKPGHSCDQMTLQLCPLWDPGDEQHSAECHRTASRARVSLGDRIYPARLWVPMRTDGRLVGGICIIDSSRSEFSPEDAELITGLANQASIALENAALYKQVQQIAVLEERDRIARELHDGLAQVLGYLKLKVETVERLLDQGEVHQTHSELVSMNEVINETYEDVRGAIMGLKTMIQPGPELLSRLEEALRRFGVEHEVETELVIKNKDLPALSLEVQIQLIRVIQECLSNVAKHANASKVTIEFERLEERLCVTIEDDGLGFDPQRLAEPSWRHVGLRTSRERIASVGGSLQIESSLGWGTRVIVHLPF